MKKFTLRVLWLKHNIAFAIDHIAKQGHSPLTPYFFWPRNDAWKQVKNELDSKPWISEDDKINILNDVTEIVNYWHNNSYKRCIHEVQTVFPDLIFHGIQ